MRLLVFVMAAGLVSACGSRVATTEAPSRSAGPTLPAEPVEVRLTPYFRELRTVEAISGDDTLRLLLDTGGGHTLLTPEAARRLGCQPYGRSVGHRMSGERVEFARCADISLRVGGLTLGPGSVAVFDLGAVLPPELPGLDGLLALPSFVDRVVTIDLAGDRLTFESERSAASRRAGQWSLRSRAATGDDGSSLTLLVAAEAEPGQLWLLLDSGNLTGTILSPSGARHLARGGTDLQSGTTIALDLQRIGLPGRSTRATIRDIIYDGVLGASFFLENTMTIDLRGRQPRVGVEIRDEP